MGINVLYYYCPSDHIATRTLLLSTIQHIQKSVAKL